MKDNDYQATIFPGTRAGLQAAIDSGSSGKTKVSIGPGVLLIDSALTLNSHVHIEGSGMGKTVLKHSGTTLHTMITGASKTNWILSDLSIDGDQTGVSTYNADRWLREETIDLSSCTDFTIRNVEITACRGQSIYGTSCTRGTIQDCWIHDTDNWGAVFKVADDIDFINNHLDTLYTHGLYVDSQTNASGSNRIRFIGNTCISVANDAAHADSGVGISVQNAGSTSGTYDVVCIGNICKNNGSMGFSMTPSKRSETHAGKMVIIGNHSEGHTSNGANGYEIIGTNVVGYGNTAKNNGTAFEIQDSKGVLICGNRILCTIGSSQIACILSPASVTAWCEDVTFSDNIVEGGTGFQISSQATNSPHSAIQILGNKFIACENGVLFQVKAGLVSVCDNMIDNTNASVSVGRGIRVCGSEVVVARNIITTKTTANGIEFNVAATTDAAELRDNVVLQSNYPLTTTQAVTTMSVNGNRFTAGTTGTFQSKNNVTNWRDGGDNSWNYVTAAPASEYWHVGTKVYDTAVAPSSFIGWVCTTAGTPGTWKTWGATSA